MDFQWWSSRSNKDWIYTTCYNNPQTNRPLDKINEKMVFKTLGNNTILSEGWKTNEVNPKSLYCLEKMFMTWWRETDSGRIPVRKWSWEARKIKAVTSQRRRFWERENYTKIGLRICGQSGEHRLHQPAESWLTHVCEGTTQTGKTDPRELKRRALLTGKTAIALNN